MTQTQIDTKKLSQGYELIDSLNDDELNELVDYIRTTYKVRAQRRNAEARLKLRAGMRVRLGGPTKPQYLEGLEGTVIEPRTSVWGRVVWCLKKPLPKRLAEEGREAVA